MNRKLGYIGIVILLIACLIGSIIVAVTMGTVSISVQEVYAIMGHKLFGIGAADLYGKGARHDVIWLIRLPRLLLAAAVGCGLAVCGVIMQAIVKNPLADPYVLGVSSGASLGATFAIMLGVGSMFGNSAIGVCAFIGAFGSAILVMLTANIGGRANSVKLLLAGMALSAICSSFSSFIIYIANDREGMQDLTFWMMGSLAGAKWETLGMIYGVVILGFIFFWTQSRTLNLMLLGDEVSVTLGTDLHRWRQIYLVIVALIIGFVVYAAGMIGFVGLIVPHVVRMIFGTNHRKIIPLAALIGAIFLIWADVLCRIIIPNTELPIGILTSMIGAPCFIYLMVRRKYGFGGA